jgi:hypothetical protein
VSLVAVYLTCPGIFGSYALLWPTRKKREEYEAHRSTDRIEQQAEAQTACWIKGFMGSKDLEGLDRGPIHIAKFFFRAAIYVRLSNKPKEKHSLIYQKYEHEAAEYGTERNHESLHVDFDGAEA